MTARDDIVDRLYRLDADHCGVINAFGEAAREITRLRALERDAPMREALEKIARLTLSSDMSDEDQADGDFEGAYDYMVELARAALSQKESKT